MPLPTLRHTNMKPNTGATGTLEKSIIANSRSFGLIDSSDISSGLLPRLFLKVTLGIDAASVSVSAIPSTHTHLLINILGRTNVASTVDNINMRVETGFVVDSGASYDFLQEFANHTSTFVDAAVATTFWRVGTFAGDTAPAGSSGATSMLIYNYSVSGKQKQYTLLNASSFGTTTAGHYVMNTGGVWRGTGIIDGVVIFPNTGTALKTGTVIEVVGLP